MITDDNIEALWGNCMVENHFHNDARTRRTFARLIEQRAREEEREACAKVCDDIDVEYGGEEVLATWCASSIRARGRS